MARCSLTHGANSTTKAMRWQQRPSRWLPVRVAARSHEADPEAFQASTEAAHGNLSRSTPSIADQRQSRHGTADRGHVGVGGYPEHFVTAEPDFFAQQVERFGRQFFERDGEHGGPARHDGATTRPVVDLAGIGTPRVGQSGPG